MNTMKNTIIGVIAVAALALGGYLYFNQSHNLGANAGNDFYNPVFFHQTATTGGNLVATSSVGTATYTAANILNTSLITHTAASSLTVTFPASSTLTNFAPNPGDQRTVCVNPVTTLITFAAGTGETLSSASTTKIVSAGQVGCFNFIRKSNHDFSILMTAD